MIENLRASCVSTMAPRPTTSVSVVICTYSDRRFSDLQAAIASLLAQDVPLREIVVAVDRNPRLLERIRQNLPSVLAVENDRHPGAGGARNAGVAASTGELVAFIDDDVVVDPGWLRTITDPFDDPAVMGVGGSIRPLWSSRRPRWFPEEFDWVIGCSYRGLPEVNAHVRNVISANMVIRREVFTSIGGFLPGFGKEGAESEPEETELCIRAGIARPEQVWLYVPEARVGHRVTAERETWGYFVRRCINEGRGKARMRTVNQFAKRLESERTYVRRTLPAGVARAVREGIRGDRSGYARAAAIFAGFGVTAWSCLRETLTSGTSPAPERAALARIPVISTEPARV